MEDRDRPTSRSMATPVLGGSALIFAIIFNQISNQLDDIEQRMNARLLHVERELMVLENQLNRLELRLERQAEYGQGK